MSATTTPQHAFHRLLTFFTNRPSPLSNPSTPPTTISFMDSLRADLSLGLNLPIALILALTRHLVFKNTGTFSLSIHIPTLKTSRTLLGGPNACPTLQESKRYSCGELFRLAKPAGLVAQLDAVGLWMLAAEKDGKVLGKEVRLFQTGEVMEGIRERRKGVENILPFWRGGPAIPAAHSWAVKKLFHVDVYHGHKRV